ncbi:DUF2190 family protein [uncultured Desulfovibrio sp.]|uniref:DUF2190 family protein n=1 Tax=uncultured Desulfovibrio sp. TaxID=167968 RepID=UPI0026264D3D|nr:DUF2190 family protein [uncultured Desulfovibrio sp.]
MQNAYSMGRCIHHTPAKAVLGGELVVLTGMVAVASTDIPANEEGACEVEGVFALPKKAGETPKQGAPLYLAEDKTLTVTAGTQFVGTAWADAPANDPTVLCRINFGCGAAGAAAAASEQGS